MGIACLILLLFMKINYFHCNLFLLFQVMKLTNFPYHDAGLILFIEQSPGLLKMKWQKTLNEVMSTVIDLLC